MTNSEVRIPNQAQMKENANRSPELLQSFVIRVSGFEFESSGALTRAGSKEYD